MVYGLKYLGHLITSGKFTEGMLPHTDDISPGLFLKPFGMSDDENLKNIKAFTGYLRRKNNLIDCSDDAGAGSKIPGNPDFIRAGRLVKRSSVDHKCGRFLYHLVETCKPGNIIELGTSLGISTAYLASGWEGTTVWTIESCRNKLEMAEENMQMLGIRNVRFYPGLFRDVLPRILRIIPSVDLVFMDGDHRFESTLSYFHIIRRYIHENTILVVDDIHWSSGMEKAWQEISSPPSAKVSIDLFRVGVIYFNSKLPVEKYKIRY